MDSGKMDLRPRTTPNAEVCRSGDTGWHLTLPPGPERESTVGRSWMIICIENGRISSGDHHSV